VLRFRIDRLPDDLKEKALELLPQLIDEAKNSPIPPDAKELVHELLDDRPTPGKMGITEGKEISFRLDLDAKTGSFMTSRRSKRKAERLSPSRSRSCRPPRTTSPDWSGPTRRPILLVQRRCFATTFKMPEQARRNGAKAAERNWPEMPPKRPRTRGGSLHRAGTNGEKRTMDLAASLRGPTRTTNIRLSAPSA